MCGIMLWLFTCFQYDLPVNENKTSHTSAFLLWQKMLKVYGWKIRNEEEPNQSPANITCRTENNTQTTRYPGKLFVLCIQLSVLTLSKLQANKKICYIHSTMAICPYFSMCTFHFLDNYSKCLLVFSSFTHDTMSCIVFLALALESNRLLNALCLSLKTRFDVLIYWLYCSIIGKASLLHLENTLILSRKHMNTIQKTH